MNTYKPADIRNFAIVGHASAGKTMLSECMLVCAGQLSRLGSIAAGTTASDYHDNERERKISIQSTLLHCEWMNKKFNIMDTPGYLDFISEGLAALRVADFALIVVDAKGGVGVGTRQVWDYATQFNLPKIFVVNGLDKEGADFDAAVEQIRQSFGDKIFPMSCPANPGPGFNQVLDVMRSEVVTYANDKSGKYQEVPATGAALERVQTLHKEAIEHVAEADDALMEKFFEEGGTLTEDELRAGLHKAIQAQTIIPVFCACAEQNIGVARIMDIIAKYGSSPADHPATIATDSNGAETKVSLSAPETVLFVFKTMNEAKFGELSFFRIYSGSVHVGQELYNAERRTSEKIGQIYILNGQTRLNVETLCAGDIGTTVKLKDTHTGNTLCTPKSVVTLPKVQLPHPNIHAAIELKVKGEEDKLSQGLAALHAADPTFMHTVDGELHQTVISAQGEMHLSIITEELKRRYKVEIDLTAPRIRFRETIKSKGDSKYRHKKQTGGAGQFAEVWMRIEPAPRDSGVDFTNSLVGQNVDRVFVPSVEKGVKRACTEGILAGYHVTDVKVDFYDGKMHPVDSKDIAFQVAGYEAFKEAFRAARPCLLEPIHNVEIRVPDDCMGSVMGDLSSRRGKIQGMDSERGVQIIKAQVPAMELYRYSTNLRSLTGGRGIHFETFSHYEEMPSMMQQKVIDESKKAKEASNNEK